jgi:anti-anti-sigma factor
MTRSRRRSSAPGHGTPPYPAGPFPRGSDVAVTCWERVHGPVPEGAPAARVVGPAPAGDGRPALVEVVLGPELVAARAVEIRAVVDAVLLSAPAVLRLGLEEVQRFDAAGVGLLLRAHQQARQHGVVLICTGPPVQLVSVLRRTKLDHVLTVQL